MQIKNFILLVTTLSMTPSICLSADVVIHFHSAESTNIIHLESSRYTINELCVSNEPPEAIKSCIISNIIPQNLNISITAISQDSRVSERSNVLNLTLSEFRTKALHTLVCSEPRSLDALLVLNASVGIGIEELCE